MKGYRFYEELENKNRKGEKSQGNVIAIALEKKNGRWNPLYHFVNGRAMYEGLSATFYRENSPVSWGSIDVNYLRENCKRISEGKAREIHPALFQRLDD